MAAETPEIPYRRIGTILVEWRLISRGRAHRALAEQEETGRLLGEILVTSYGVSRVDLADALAEQWQEANRAATDGDRRSATLAALGRAWTTQPVAESLAEADLRVSPRRGRGRTSRADGADGGAEPAAGNTGDARRRRHRGAGGAPHVGRR